MVYIGGAGFFYGPIIGAILISLIQLSLSDITPAWLLYLGLLFVVTVLFAPAGIEVVRYASQEEVFLDLVAGRIDASLADAVSIQFGFLQTDAGKGFATVGPAFTDRKYFGEGIGVAVRKGDTALVEKFNAAIDAIRANGKYQQIAKKYFDFDIYGE